MNLYETSKELATINDEIISESGEISPDLEAKLDALQLSFNDKVSNIGRWALNVIRKEDVLSAEIERLQKRKATFEKLRDRLKDYVKMCMQVADKKKIELAQFTVYVQSNPPSVEIVDPQVLPSHYVKIIQATNIDRAAILQDLKQGRPVAGARLITDKTHLRIR